MAGLDPSTNGRFSGVHRLAKLGQDRGDAVEPPALIGIADELEDRGFRRRHPHGPTRGDAFQHGRSLEIAACHEPTKSVVFCKT